jgi:hypothetical protein
MHCCVFEDEEELYRAWRDAHREGLVLNCERSPKASYLILHRTTCVSMAGEPARGELWTKDYIKVCATDRDSIERWASQVTGGKPKDCDLCRP